MTPRSLLNRILLALTGLVLLVGGLLVVAPGLDLYRRLDLVPPSGWPLTTPGDVLLSSADRKQWRNESWWWPAVIAALTIVTLLALWWLLAQLSRRGPRTMSLGSSPPQGGVELRCRALGDAIATEASALPGVQTAMVRVTGRPGHPHAHIHLTLAPHGEPAAALDALCKGPLSTARQSTGQRDLPAEAHLRVSRHRAQRTR